MQSQIGTLLDLENDLNAFEILMHVTGNGGDMAEMDSRIVRHISKATGVTYHGDVACESGSSRRLH